MYVILLYSVATAPGPVVYPFSEWWLSFKYVSHQILWVCCLILYALIENLRNCFVANYFFFPANYFCSVSQSCMTLWDPKDYSMPGCSVLHHLLKFVQILTSIESVVPFNNLILCHPLLLLPSVFSSIRIFSNESALHIR